MFLKLAIKFHFLDWAINSLFKGNPFNQDEVLYTGEVKVGQRFSRIVYNGGGFGGGESIYYDCQVVDVDLSQKTPRIHFTFLSSLGYGKPIRNYRGDEMYFFLTRSVFLYT